MNELMQYSKTREELLQNTIDRFNANNRSSSGGNTCRYRYEPINGQPVRACAIGREIPDKLAYELDGMADSGVDIDEVFEMLPKHLQNMGKNFLYHVQRLHDGRPYWSPEGLSEEGRLRVGKIVELFDLKNIKF